MKRVFSIFLIIIMLVTNVGITFATHYCGGKAVKTDISIGKSHLDCGMAGMDVSCKNHTTDTSIKRKGCCENRYLQLKIDTDYSISLVLAAAQTVVAVADFAYNYSNRYFHIYSAEAEYLNYSPPLLNLDIPVLIQSFLK